MPFTPVPLLAASLKAVARSFLLLLGLDHVLLDFLANAAVGALAILLTILFVGFRIPRWSWPPNPQMPYRLRFCRFRNEAVPNRRVARPRS